MKYFHGSKKKKKYFEGWYLKHQKGAQSLSFIPAYHIDEQGNRSVSIQVITKSTSYFIPYPIESFRVQQDRFCCHIGGNVFSENGCIIDIETEELCIKGRLKYQNFLMPKADVMGPFRYTSRMQCNHGIISMTHFLKGHLLVNGEKLDFTDGLGYIETDWGTSFPKEYLWTQSGYVDKGPANIMIALAQIPIGKWSFPGCIGSVYYQGEEYLLATYLGARYSYTKKGIVTISQGRYLLKAKIDNRNAQLLKAPSDGKMLRNVYESLECNVQYLFYKDGQLILNHRTNYGSVEDTRAEDTRAEDTRAEEV